MRVAGAEFLEMLPVFIEHLTLQLTNPTDVLLDGYSTRGKKELLKKEPIQINPTGDSSKV